MSGRQPKDPPEVERKRLLADLERYHPRDVVELSVRDLMCAFVTREPRCFERSAREGHLTASAWIVDPQRHSTVLVLHKKLGRWLQPGGHADGDGDLRRVALREAAEETGFTTLRLAAASIYDVDVHEIPAHQSEPMHFHYDVRFAFVADACEPFVISDESHDVAWIAISSLERYGIDESVFRLARKTSGLLM